ncbi:MAG TPA: fused MFS/spermidine synthase [Thermoanaerobaculia bacterium]|nr:fused MFS/spermidine synthase [Thermoanaerobaculia bacterium]
MPAASLPTGLPRRLVLLTLVCLTASGSAGLIAEVVWSRVLAAMFGSALTGTGLLLAIFMAGLGIGSVAGARVVARGRIAPLAAFGLVEITIGALVFATPALFRFVEPATLRIESRLSDAMAPLAPALASIFILGPIVVLMGMTFPLFLAGIRGRDEEVGVDAGWVYGINTFGAVAGTVAAGFWLLPAIGITRSLFIAGTIDLIVGAVILVVARRTSLSTRNQREPLELEAWSPRVRRAFTIALLGGAAALVLEVAWFRALMSIFGSSVYAISLMLAAFLFGLAAGSIAGAPRVTQRPPLAQLHTSIAFTATLVTFLLQIVPLGFIILLERYGRSFPIVNFGTSLLLFITLIVPTALMGAALPAVIAWGAGERSSSAGRIYAGSSLGSAVGALAGGFVLVPLAGVRGAVLAAALLSLAAAFLALKTTPDRDAARTSLRVVIATAVMWAIWLGGLLPWNWQALTGGPYAYAHLYSGTAEASGRPTTRRVELRSNYVFGEGVPEAAEEAPPGEARLLSWRDGRYAQVAVTEEGGIRTLLLNGKADASTARADMRTQLLLGHLPALLAPVEPSGTAMVIGLGSGVTAGAVAAWPFERIIAAEIEPEVARAAEWFREENRNVLADPRFELRTDDGRRILARTSEPITLLTSEPSNLWMSGVSLLFTAEFFELAAARLGERGVFCQWLHLYQIGENDVRTFLATIATAFPNLVVVADEADLFVVASRAPLNLDPEVWAKRLASNAAAREALARAGIRSTADIAAGILADARAVRAWSAGARLHRDDHPILEFTAARNMSFDRSRQILSDLAAAGERAGPIPLGNSGIVH